MKKSFALLSLIFSFIFIFSACKKDSGEDLNTLEAIINSGGGFELTTNSNEVISSETESVEIDGATWSCTTETLSVQQGGGGDSGFPLFNPNAGIIYPGNLLQGNSLHLATPRTITVDRAGGSVSTDVVDGNLAPSFTVSSVVKSEMAIAINNIINNSTGVVPANFDFTYENIQSREQFALELGVDVSTAFTDFESNVSFSSDREYNRYYVSLNQSFYTMSFDEPTSPESVFAETVTPDDLAKFTGEGNPATYISDVTYGRIYYMLIESTSSVTEMDASINASFSGVVNTVDGSIDASYLSELDDLKIQVFAFGGSSAETLMTIGETNLSNLVDLLAQSSDIRSGKPISYVVKSLYDNQIVSVQLATQYDVTNCEPTGVDGAPPYTSHWTGEVVSKMGPVGAAYNTYGNEFILISKDGQQFMRSNPGSLEGPFSIHELGDGPCPLEGGVGAATNLNGNQDGDFYLMAFDKLGINYTYMNPSGNWSTQIRPISDLADGSNPFNISGIGAVAFKWVDPLGPSSRYMFNLDGDQYSSYVNNPQSFSTVRDLWQWGPDNTCPFDAVGAAIGFYIGDDQFYIHFSESGTQYSLYGNVDGTGNHKFIGPFSL